MKLIKIITVVLFYVSNTHAQLLVSDFESFTLSPGSFYNDTNSTSFNTQNAIFQHKNSNFSGWIWTGGFAYTNAKDSSNGSYTNLYGVKAFNGYNGSDIFVVGQNRGVIQLASAQNTVDGFYITNTTFAYKSMLLGDTANGFSRRFGDTTGTGSGNTIAQGGYPDYFKLTIKGFKNGQLKADSVEFYLADYRFQNNSLDYIVDNWQWVNTSSLGEVDSLKFWMLSSDVGQFGINTPLFFALDNFSTNGEITQIEEVDIFASVKVYPVPFQNQLNISINKDLPVNNHLKIMDVQGRCLLNTQLKANENNLELSALIPGVYLLELREGANVKRLKIVKE